MTRQTEQRCNRRLRDQWQPAPRTCAVCGLFGHCRDVEFAAADDAPAEPVEAVPAVTSGTLLAGANFAAVKPVLQFGGAEGWVVRLHYDPPSVELNPGVTWDDAAKAFWNGVAAVRGLSPLFPAEREKAP